LLQRRLLAARSKGSEINGGNPHFCIGSYRFLQGFIYGENPLNRCIQQFRQTAQRVTPHCDDEAPRLIDAYTSNLLVQQQINIEQTIDGSEADELLAVQDD
jgi:hypothetical protein